MWWSFFWYQDSQDSRSLSRVDVCKSVELYLALADRMNRSLEVGSPRHHRAEIKHLKQSMAAGKLAQCGTSSYLDRHLGSSFLTDSD